MTDPSPLFDTLAAFRARLAKRETQAFNTLIDAYRGAYGRMSTEIELLLRIAAEQGLTKGQVARMDRYKRVMADVAQELQALQALTAVETDKAARLGIDLGLRDARELISVSATGSTRLSGAFKTLPKEAVETLIGFLAPDSPLYKRLRLIAPYNAQLVSDAIISGVAAGFGPGKTARLVQDAFGRGLTDSLRFVRTAQLYSYREATRAGYLANADILEGWVWHAALDDRVCMSCVANHGKVYPLDQRLNDHHNGRCTAIPLVRGFPNPVTESGEDWFGKQAESKQRLLMGKGAHAAWKEGKFAIPQMTIEREDAIYGKMRSVAPLKDLLTGRVVAQSRETLDNIEALHDFIASPTETAYIFIDNELVLKKGGNETSVVFSPDEWKKMANGILTHNHPGGSSLSTDDVTMAVTANLREIRAVGSRGTYIMTRPENGWSVSEAYIRGFVKRSWRSWVRTDKQQDPWDFTWERFAKRGEGIYKFIPRNE